MIWGFVVLGLDFRGRLPAKTNIELEHNKKLKMIHGTGVLLFSTRDFSRGKGEINRIQTDLSVSLSLPTIVGVLAIAGRLRVVSLKISLRRCLKTPDNQCFATTGILTNNQCFAVVGVLANNHDGVQF